MNESKKYYDLLASVYDKATEIPGAWNPPRIIYDAIKNRVSNQSKILDIGVGTGQSIAEIYCQGQYKEIYGVDVSPNMLDICRVKYPNVKLSQIFSIRDIEKIDDYFDIVISSGTIEFIEDLDMLFQQVRRKQGKDSIFAFTYEPIIYLHPFQKDEKSLTVLDKSSKLYVEKFYTYRHKPQEILNLLNKNNYEIIEDYEFVAYKKGPEQIIYHIIVATTRN